MTFPDPGIPDDEAVNAIARLEDRFNQGDLTPDHPVRSTRMDPLAYSRWYSSYVVKRANAMPHERAIQQVLAEIDVVVHGRPVHAGPRLPLEHLANIRGAMWTQRLKLPMGPYPDKDYNINAMDFYELYGPDDRKRMIERTLADGYTHAVTGPIYDEGGYHGRYPAQTTIDQPTWDRYLDAMQEWQDAGIIPVHFVKPDHWTLPDVRLRLEPLYTQPRAQALLPILVPAGWEPVTYQWSSRTWGTFFDWAAEVNPEALILAHSAPDIDALKGTDRVYNDEPEMNNLAWVYLAPKLHGWLIQLNGYVNITVNDPERPAKIGQWRRNLAGYFRDADARFRDGKAGWPTGSKFGPAVPLKLYCAECSSYAFFWNQPAISEDEVREWGAVAMQAGADGFLDGGLV